jgi:hypothetical protein
LCSSPRWLTCVATPYPIASQPRRHLPQRRSSTALAGVHEVEDPTNGFASVFAVQAAGVLLQRAFPRNRHGQHQGIQRQPAKVPVARGRQLMHRRKMRNVFTLVFRHPQVGGSKIVFKSGSRAVTDAVTASRRATRQPRSLTAAKTFGSAPGHQVTVSGRPRYPSPSQSTACGPKHLSEFTA